VTESSMGHVQLQGQTLSMALPTADPIGFAAVPSASVPGFPVLGAVDVMNLTTGAGAITTTIGVSNAETVISNPNATQLLVFSPNGPNSVTSNSVTVLSPQLAMPPVDTSCNNPSTPANPQPNAVCTVVPGFDEPVFAIINGTTAYILNCGPECGGTQASVAVFDLNSLTVTQTIPVDAATYAVLTGSTLLVAGTPPTNNACTGQTTAATTCGRLDIVDLTSGTVTSRIVITDGYHNHMDFSNNGQLFIGSRGCTNIGNVNIPSGEVRGCLSIYNSDKNTVIVPPDNGDVFGLQSFSTRFIEYVAQGGNLRVYDTTKDILLINDFVPQGTINIVGFVGDVKAIDFF
jgi:hypothetical protein